MSPSTLTTSAFVAAWSRMRVAPDPAVGGSAVQLRDPETESTTTLLTVKVLGGWSRMHPSELPPATLVAVNEILVATPLVTEDGDLAIVQPPLAALASPEPNTKSARADSPATQRFGCLAGVTVSASLVRRPDGSEPRDVRWQARPSPATARRRRYGGRRGTASRVTRRAGSRRRPRAAGAPPRPRMPCDTAWLSSSLKTRRPRPGSARLVGCRRRRGHADSHVRPTARDDDERRRG